MIEWILGYIITVLVCALSVVSTIAYQQRKQLNGIVDSLKQYADGYEKRQKDRQHTIN